MNRRGQPDSYYQKAKQEGFAARSVYKLKEMDQRYRLLRGGSRVLDLGSHPGSWLQYAAARVGPNGLVVGVDRQPLPVALPGNARFLEADLLALPVEAVAPYAPFDLVMSDAAPRTTGVSHADVAGTLALAEKALDLAEALLKPGGAFVAKVFMGPGVEELLARLRRGFAPAKAHKPTASRAQSREIYLFGRGRPRPAV